MARNEASGAPGQSGSTPAPAGQREAEPKSSAGQLPNSGRSLGKARGFPCLAGFVSSLITYRCTRSVRTQVDGGGPQIDEASNFPRTRGPKIGPGDYKRATSQRVEVDWIQPQRAYACERRDDREATSMRSAAAAWIELARNSSPWTHYIRKYDPKHAVPRAERNRGQKTASS